MPQKLSIITINYNNASGLQKTIESVVNQSISDIEFVVVDGGSTDESVEIIKKHESKITQWISEKDNGIYHALNKGIQLATGEYLLFLNSGDHLIDTTVLKNNINFLDGTQIIAFDIKIVHGSQSEIFSHPDQIHFSYLYNETLAHQSIIIKKDLFDKVGMYDEKLKIVSDWKFFIEAIAINRASYKAIHNVLSVYYLDGISASAEGTFTRRKERNEVLKQDFSVFNADYQELKKLEGNRHKMLNEIEQTSFGRKFVSLIFRLYIFTFSKKKLKDILK